MYYNIKIKSNGSEFILESNNKEVTQREMDVYFAHIFGASEEFNSKIKKIEVTNSNVKSINEIEKINPNKQQENIRPQVSFSQEQIEAMANLKAQKIIEEKIKQEEAFKKAQELAKQQEEARKQVEEMQRKALELAKKQEEQIVIQTLPTETITFQNQPTVNLQNTFKEQNSQAYSINSTQKQEEKTSFATNDSQQAPEIQDDIDELINLAQQKLELKPSSNNDDVYLNFNKDNLEDLSILPDIRIEESEIEHHYQSKIDDIFNSTPNNQQEELQIQTPTLAPNNKELEEIMTTIAQEISQIEILPEALDDVVLQQEVSEIQIEPSVEKQEVAKNPDYNYLPEEDEISQEQPSQTSMTSAAAELDFKPFLAGFACNEIIDEFLICAYFIKNVLRKSDFTIKFINSKLFQATGKIANLSVIDELISREYIKTIDTDEGKKYSITMDGEGYFAEKFQG